ncbi:type II secretion system F family protein [Promicromonospora iranensis]|uniref:Tight adherence protein B n=1 Tax=Promicromonospora iranensis TaxID=1105144 RepID=A0ABU2CNR1_9MICO|nr:type II secretion system F family protein [Promicromonospora iranensis]MDR7382959.1 tight adherence protein B [Promicromonospora iranensis]
MVRFAESWGVGLLVAIGAWLMLARGGRRLREVLVPPGRASGPEPGALTGALTGVAPVVDVTSAARRRRTLRVARGPGGDVRVVVMQVVALLRAGSPPGVAWSRAADVGVDLTGVPDVDELSRVLGVRHAEAVAAATRLALDVGAPLGRVLEQVAATLVAEAEARAERDAALAGPRTTGRLLMWLPIVGGLLGWALGADPVGTATDGGIGSLAVGMGLVLLVGGRIWSDRLVAAARGADQAGVDVQVVLALVAAALRSGAGVPRALEATGVAVGGSDGLELTRAAHALVLGADWERAWTGVRGELAPMVRALRGAWLDGAAPGEALGAAGEEVRHERRATARTAAARLGVRLVLPLGTCYLPAFVLVGLVPVLLALGIDLLAG